MANSLLLPIIGLDCLPYSTITIIISTLQTPMKYSITGRKRDWSSETEFKQEIDWRDNGNTVYYKNNKTWSVVYMKHQQNLGKVANMVLNGLLLLLGESPLRAVTQGGASFESYPDPLITLINSNLTKTLMAILGNSVPLPNIPAMGFFPLEYATVEDFYKVGEVRILVNTSMAMNINSFEQLRPDSNVCG
ncbi:hypothetical protein RB195_019559 [Necator americanus]|uniref:CD36 family protein n=1 Tax=Necator americanus TaxID=51031 RepID=A0ABR1CER2_NECAM